MGLRLVFNHHLRGDESLDIEGIYRLAYNDFYGRDPSGELILKTCNDRLANVPDPHWLVHFHRKVIQQIDAGTYEFLLPVGILIA